MERGIEEFLGWEFQAQYHLYAAKLWHQEEDARCQTWPYRRTPIDGSRSEFAPVIRVHSKQLRIHCVPSREYTLIRVKRPSLPTNVGLLVPSIIDI